MAEFTLIIQSINGEVTNVTESGIAGEALTSGQLVYLHTDGKWYKATSINVNKCSTELRLTTESKSTNELINLLLYGELIVSGPLTTGSKYYVGETLGTVTDTPSINDNHYQRYVGTAKNVDSIIFNPDATYIRIDGKEIDGIATGSNYVVINESNNYTTSAFEMVLVDATTGNKTITLPPASSNTNVEISIKKIDNSSNEVIIEGNGIDTIDGFLNIIINYQWTSITVLSDGVNWFIK